MFDAFCNGTNLLTVYFVKVTLFNLETFANIRRPNC